MGRVSLIVEANTSDAITKITSLGQTIQTTMKKFESSAAENGINKARTVLQKLSEELTSFSNLFKADVPFGASKSLAAYKKSLEGLFNDLTNFKTSFKEGYEFGAVAQLDAFKSKIAEAKEAVATLNAELSNQTKSGVNQAAQGRKDEISKLIGAAKKLNEQLAVKPVLGARQAIVEFESGLKSFSQNVGTLIAPAFISLNMLKERMQELSQVLNSVQQPTWVEPFKRQMLEVVGVLNQIGEAYTRVRREIRQSVGESSVRREFQMTDRQAQNLYRTTTMFYRHIRREFQETRTAANETSRAIREAMAAVQGGGGGGGGGGAGGTHGARLGFGEQLWSRMRSNLYSYLTMWFGVAGAIRLANGLLEEHNRFLERGKEFNQTEYEALGELNLKAGEKAPEYEAAAKKLARGGFGSTRDAYQFASAAAMSGISVKDMEEIAPIFRSNLAAGGDQKALMAAISYIKSTYGDQYSTKEIAAMILEANSNNPSNIAPTANAIQNLIESYGGMGIPLPDLIAMFTVGSEKNKDARIGTMLRAFGTAMRTKGLEAMAIGDVMSERGIAGYDYYKDERTGAYKFKDEELQRQLESGDLKLDMETLTHWAKGKGREIVKDIGANLRTWGGAQLLAGIATNPEEYNRVLAELEAIAAGDTSKMDKARIRTDTNIGVATVQGEKAATAIQEQEAQYDASLDTNIKSVRDIYGAKYSAWWYPYRAFQKAGEWALDGVSSRAEKLYGMRKYVEAIEQDDAFTEEQKEQARNNFITAIRAAVEAEAKDQGIDTSTQEGLHEAFQHFRFMIGHFDSEEASQALSANFGEAYRRSLSLITKDTAPAKKPATGAVKAIEEGTKYVNKDDAAKRDAKDADKKAKDEAAEEKARLAAVPGATLSAPENTFIASQLGIALTDTDANLQEMKGAALGSVISNKKTRNNILGEALYAYASEKTDEATDKKIVEQLVASLNQQGLSLPGIEKLALAYSGEVSENVDSEGNKEIAKRFFEDIKSLLVSINEGTSVLKEPEINKPKR